ncbi:Hypothetical_protein [Hexamita inflata]|uniref:Hypothetical_protein n=1 Tax=Hexamita inflata TaxID=28002 RepID=A0ABP1H9J7_9EUKA
MNQYTKLQQLYLNDLDSPGAVQFKEVSQQQYFSKTSKVMQCCQFLNKELMSELYVRTNLILDILENQSNINSFGTTTNTVECEFELTKNLCNGKQTPQVMKGVISRQLKQKAAFYQNNNDQYLIHREKYARIFQGMNTMSRSIQQSLSMQAIFIYDSISNNARHSIDPQKLVDMLNNLDEKYKFFKILLLDNQNLCQEVDDKNCVVGSTQQGKLPKIIELGKFSKQEQKKK